MSIEVDTYSRFLRSDSVFVDNIETFGLLKRPNFLDVESLDQETEVIDFRVVWPFVGRPDAIAREVYGVQFLDWIIILSQNPRNTLNWPPNGITLRLPASEVVFGEGV